MIGLEEFEQVWERIKPYVDTTPLRYSSWLSELVGGDIYLKYENLNPGRSFKIRGATNALLSQDELPKTVLTASGGNHGLGVAIAAQRLELPCHVVLPSSTSPYRVELLEKLGASVTLHGAAWDDANRLALQLAEDPEQFYIHPFADHAVIMGQGTIALELREQLDNFDDMGNLVASVGGGGLLAGSALALEAMGHQSRIVAVETQGADSLAQSLDAGQLVELEAITSIAKTLGARKTTEYILETMQRLVSDMRVITDRRAVEMIFEFLDHEKMLVEPATSCSVAAVLDYPEQFADRTSVIIVCGSNVSYSEALAWKSEFLDG